MADCKACKEQMETNEAMTTVTMSSADYQKGEQRHERREKRFIAVIVLLIALLVGSNIAWLVYESQFEDIITETTVDATGDGIARYIGNDGDIIYGENYSKNENSEEEKEAGQVSDLR